MALQLVRCAQNALTACLTHARPSSRPPPTPQVMSRSSHRSRRSARLVVEISTAGRAFLEINMLLGDQAPARTHNSELFVSNSYACPPVLGRACTTPVSHPARETPICARAQAHSTASVRPFLCAHCMLVFAAPRRLLRALSLGCDGHPGG